MRLRSLLLFLCASLGIIGFADNPQASGPSVVFHAIADLPGGGATTVIKDATRVGGVIYAVGGAVTRLTCPAAGSLPGPCTNTDTAILWRSDGSPTQVLPDIVSSPSTLAVNAFAITRDALYIASTARDNTTAVPPVATIRAVRVETSSLTNLNLNAFSPPLPNTASAVAISTGGSTNGTVLYGRAGGRGARFDTSNSTTVLIPLICPAVNAQCPVADVFNPVAERGSSANGNVAVGTSFPSFDGTRRKAYRYVHGSGVSAIPALDRTGGSTNAFHGNDALAVSPDGNLVLLTGDSDEFPNGEAYLYDFTKPAAEAITTLGAPNGSLAAPWRPGGRFCANQVCSPNLNVGGMTADGSVVAMNFSGVPGVEGQGAYFHNAYGWFNLLSVLNANGANVVLDGWEDLFIQGISPDGMLVYGAGKHFDPVAGYNKVDGFVADFTNAAIKLKDYNPQPVPVANTSIVGAWTNDLANPGFVFLFTADGVYYHVEDVKKVGNVPPNPPAGTRLTTGFERGLYYFNGSGISFTTLVDTNGDIGASGADGFTFPASISGDILTFDEGDGGPPDHMYRIVGSPGSFAGGWIAGNPTQRDHSFAVVALANGQIFQANDHIDFGSEEADRGTYTFAPVTCPAALPMGLDCYQLDLFSLDFGADIGNIAGITPDGLAIISLDDDGQTIIPLARIIDPATIPVIANTPLNASGVTNQAFNFDVNATNTVTFTAPDLPAGLSINSGTGTITGTPTVGGQFVATVKATSAVGVSDIETLTVTIAIPTPVGQNVVVEPVVPEGQGPITVSFGEVTSPGETTVETVTLEDLGGEGIPPPGNVDVGGVIYEVETTASYTGLIELCFSYEGIDFGTAEPRLFHYENNAWVDITTSVDTNTKTICGATTSLSPFAVLVSHVVRTGFYAPVNPLAGFLNTVKAGAVVPLKFNVVIDGVEKTTTSGLTLTLRTINCDTNAPEDPVEVEVAGNTGLHYDAAAGYFVQNWKAPKTPGCYMVQVITDQDGLGLTARFKVK